MSGDHNMNQTSAAWRKRQIALDKKAENARELGLDYDIHSCSPFCTQPLCVAVREAVQAERGKFLEALRQLHDSYSLASDSNIIQSRSNT